MSQKEVNTHRYWICWGMARSAKKISQKDASKGMGYRHVEFDRKKF